MNWPEYFFKLAEVAASKSKDRSTKVGCVIVGPDNEVRSMGFNGFPRGIDDDIDERHERPIKYSYTEHSERNALYNACRVGIPLNGCRLYANWLLCIECARGVIQAGIVEIIIDARDEEAKREKWKSWKDDFDFAENLLNEAGLKITFYRGEE
jgi:dCMP deaminase